MTPPPESAPPATRRAVRERTRARTQHPSAGASALPAFGDSLGPERAVVEDDVNVSAARDAAPPALPVPPALPAMSGSAAADVPPTQWADASRPPTALTWLDPSDLLDEHVPDEQPRELFAEARLTPEWRRPRVLLPLGFVVAMCAAYVSTTLLWPLHEVAPVVEASTVQIAPAPPATMTWPTTGSAAVGIEGMAPVASTTSADEIASISKVVSVMMVLDELPLTLGEQGPSYAFTAEHQRDFLQYRRSDQSSLDVPVGGSLTEYQMLQGTMLGSANNYIDRLANEIWGSPGAFAEASARWLSDRGIEGVTIASPSGFSKANVAPPAALIQIAELAMANPVFAEIVATRSADIPGAGLVTNTNKMLDDPGVVGVKTGTLTHWNLLTAKDVPFGDTTVRLYVSVLGQAGNTERLDVTRQLLAEMETTLAEQPPSVPSGTVVGHVSTEWGGRVDVVTDADARVLLWNGSEAAATSSFSLGGKTTAGAEIGTLTVKGPVGSATASVSLADDITEPSAWWRLTHPLALFGLDGD